MSNENDKNNAPENLLHRREVLKIMAAGGLASFLPITEAPSSLLAGTGLNSANASLFEGMYTLLVAEQDSGSKHKTYVEWAKEILADKGASPAVRNIMQNIIRFDSKTFLSQRGMIRKQFRNAVPGIHELAVQMLRECTEKVMEFMRPYMQEMFKDLPRPESAKKPNSKTESASGNNNKKKPSPKKLLRKAILSTDSEIVFRRISDILTKGKTGEEPFAERLINDDKTILPKR